jgi:hypothetical protein
MICPIHSTIVIKPSSPHIPLPESLYSTSAPQSCPPNFTCFSRDYHPVLFDQRHSNLLKFQTSHGGLSLVATINPQNMPPEILGNGTATEYSSASSLFEYVLKVLGIVRFPYSKVKLFIASADSRSSRVFVVRLCALRMCSSELVEVE